VILDIKGALVKRIAAELSARYRVRALGLKADITRKAEVERALKKTLSRFKRVDILINNAANDHKIGPGAKKEATRFEDFPLVNWEKDLRVGLTGAFLCSQVFGVQMAEAGKGVILNISSDLGLIAPDQRIYRKNGLAKRLQPVKPVPYSVVKHALIGLTKYLATYWAEDGVRVNAICPGGVYNGQPKDFVKKLTNLIPLGRMARRDEYKQAVLFLISDASSYMTGSTLVIDGGRHCW
jgi:NAD(P)-dependent dehydrogenase (short-subunit alcohol dehydrogenase family)